MQQHVPLVYLFGVIEGQYLPVYPVAVDGRSHVRPGAPTSLAETTESGERETDLTRNYAARVTLQRLHQETFRQRVLRAYRERHAELLDAAHILPDGHPRGEPIVPNGLAPCRLHHAAFDRYVIGIRPDLVIEVRPDVLEERDGPMLRYGLQALSGQRLLVPGSARDRPRGEFLEERYRIFRRSA